MIEDLETRLLAMIEGLGTRLLAMIEGLGMRLASCMITSSHSTNCYLICITDALQPPPSLVPSPPAIVACSTNNGEKLLSVIHTASDNSCSGGLGTRLTSSP